MVPTLSPLHPDNACPIWMRLTAIRPALIHTSGGEKKPVNNPITKYDTRAVIYTFAGVDKIYESTRELANFLGVDMSTVGRRIRSGGEFRRGGTARYVESKKRKK